MAFFYPPFFGFFSKVGLTIKVKKAKSLRKKFYDFFVNFFFRQIPFFSVQTCPNLFIFEPNITTIIWGCFSTQFFPLILILKSKMIQDDKQKSCFVSLDLSFHQIGHK